MIEFANNDLGKIKVEHLHTGLSREVAKSSNETLFLWESSNLLRSTQQKHENTSMGLEGLLNVFRVRTTWTPAPTIDSHFMQDSELEKNKKVIDEDFNDIEKLIRSGPIKRVMVPWDVDKSKGTTLGTRTGKLDTRAPLTFNHLKARIGQMIELCKERSVSVECRVRRLGVPKGTRNPPVKHKGDDLESSDNVKRRRLETRSEQQVEPKQVDQEQLQTIVVSGVQIDDEIGFTMNEDPPLLDEDNEVEPDQRMDETKD